MRKVFLSLYVGLIGVLTLGCSSTDKVSAPEMVTPDESKYSVIVTSHTENREVWQEIIDEYVDKNVVQIVTWGVNPYIEDLDIELEKNTIALVFDHKELVYTSTEPQELEDFLENKQ
ncbi:hypothetical protein GCM10011351_03430 [Paraliobacillus quinghaiensis]|uniref:Uncharacterized protein n=1 Tax=Paraliobacillus quinghaiensis TaxID=470815 RepID=A0A917THG2_9BACI|nr:hypothetical protein [Paraliobacillus quinghaiensis]GGM20893.1 hypothetical protein GCM10011351_03430 [Paraliobacillus quinghaiensis]